ncbi:MAG: ATP-dependent sacrificial sulfur transferase LarE [Eubacteriales bacterium]
MNKYLKLIEFIKKYKNCGVMFSGGTDSFFLLSAAIDAIGKDNVTAITLKTPFVSKSEIETAVSGAKMLNAKHIIIGFDILNDDNVVVNDTERCYYCKKAILGYAISKLDELKLEVLFDGTNKSDEGDYRPGMKALFEFGVISPLKQVGFEKSEIMDELKSRGFKKMARSADACLATRIKTGQKITKEKLNKIEKAEEYIKSFGVKLVRVRTIDDNAVIELLKEDIENFKKEHLGEALIKLKKIGYKNVSLSKEGYKRGSMQS